MRTREGDLKAEIKAYLKSIDAYYFMAVQTGYGVATIDFLACVKGRFIGIETKAPGNKPTPRQEQTMMLIRKAGGSAFWCDSFEGFKTALADALAE